MLDKFLEKWKNWSVNGIHSPFIFDAASKGPSITLSFSYITFLLAVGSVIALHFKADLFIATVSTIMFWLVATILYMIRKITKAKIDLDNKAIELDGGDNNEGK